MRPRTSPPSLTALLLLLTVAPSLYAQAPAEALVIEPIDESRLVTLHGTVHPLAQARYDHGPVPDSFLAGRLLLLLNRPAKRETALRMFMNDVHRRDSAIYHEWLTPDEYGRRFGPRDSDIQTAAAWLRSHGLTVARISKGKQFIEFSGTAGQVRNTFHTEVHQYDIEGETHYTNAGEISIPAALAPLIRGISPLSDFRAKPQLHVLGPATYSPATKKTTPQWTLPNGNSNFYALAPEDFATQYDLGPLYNAGINGSGQTIGIVNESNIDISLVNAYRQLFGLPSNPTQVVIDGSDPGTLGGVDIEAYLDVEVSGAVAPQATVNLYIANSAPVVTLSTDPLVFAAIRAIEDNQASVLSVSFGSCEAFLGTTGNQLWSELWEQAAAQGQTVFVSSGDTGPVCYMPQTNPAGLGLVLGIGVSGFTSTPWNVSVGGTDFYYTDYASGATSAATLWNQTNDSNLGSLKAPLPEQGWSDGFGFDVTLGDLDAGGGGGASNCAIETVTSSAITCDSGYPKPNWQTGPGVPADGVRDLPDVSLFASDGANLSATPICAVEGECAPGTDNISEIFLVGGTSVSSPTMAGIMALIDQKYGRQGQANFTLYALARQKPTGFHDITLGNDEVLCPPPPFTDCIQTQDQLPSTAVYSASANYDQATGLGSVDANVLFQNWNSITLAPTSTTLALSSTSITHGTPITATTTVAPTSSSGSPSGDVAILTNSPLPSSQSQTFLTLSGGTASGSIDFFPGGSYQVSAAYEGDGVFGSSTSSPVSLTVTPENSNSNFQVLNGLRPIGNGGTMPYNSFPTLQVQPSGVNAPAGSTDGRATGTATFTLDSTTTTVPLNAAGIATWSPSALALGSHTASATYSGDASFKASSSNPVTFIVTQGLPFVIGDIDAPLLCPPAGGACIDFYTNTGGSLTVTILAGPGPSAAGTAAPTGTVTVCLGLAADGLCGNASYTQTATLSSPSGLYSDLSAATVTFSSLAAGTYLPSATYSGDKDWLAGGWTETNEVIEVIPVPGLAPSNANLSVTPTTISGSESATITTTVTGTASVGYAPGGIVVYYDDGLLFSTAGLNPVNTVTSSATIQVDPSAFWNSGSNQITAIYNGDSNYLPSTSNAVTVTATQSASSGTPDFTLTPLSPQIAITSGSSANVTLDLASLQGFNAPVTLSCTPSLSQITCAVSPSAPTVNGTATATLTVNAFAQNSAQTADLSPRRSLPPLSGLLWLGGGSGFALASVLVGGLANRKRSCTILLSLGLITVLCALPSCGSGQSGNRQPPPANPGIYSVLVSATANGIIHDAKVTVVVQ